MMAWLKYLRVKKMPRNCRGTWWILIKFKLNRLQPCHSHCCPVPRRINIGSRYQAEVPELRQRSAVELDHHGADLVWAPMNELEEKPDFHEKGKKSTWHTISQLLHHLTPEAWNLPDRSLILEHDVLCRIWKQRAAYYYFPQSWLCSSEFLFIFYDKY